MEDYEKLYLCSFISEIQYLTIEEIERQFSLEINRSRIGLDRGVMFDTIAIKIDNWTGKYRVISYLPSGCKPNKQYDALIQVNFKKRKKD